MEDKGDNKFFMTINVSLKELVTSGAHFGHQTRRWNPKMAQYIYGNQDGVYLLDLIKTKEKLDEVLELLSNFAKDGKSILFVGTKKQANEKVKEVAESTGSFYVTERWLGGALTNFDQIKSTTKRLTEMQTKLEIGEYNDRTKKERVVIQREIDRLQRFFGGLVGLDKLPDLMVIVDTKREFTAVREAINKGVTTVGIVDTNSDPTVVDYPIPMNDDATKALSYVLGLMAEAIMEGKSVIKKETPKNDK